MTLRKFYLSLVVLLTSFLMVSVTSAFEVGTFTGSHGGVNHVTHATGELPDPYNIESGYQILDFKATNTNLYTVDFVFSLGDVEYSWFLEPNETKNIVVRIGLVDEPIPVDVQVTRNDNQVGWEFARESAQAKAKKIRKLVDSAIAGSTTRAEAQKVLKATNDLKSEINQAQKDAPASEKALFYPLIKIVNTAQTAAVKSIGPNTERLREKYLRQSRKSLVQIIGGKSL